jgi:hypothetical protein
MERLIFRKHLLKESVDMYRSHKETKPSATSIALPYDSSVKKGDIVFVANGFRQLGHPVVINHGGNVCTLEIFNEK